MAPDENGGPDGGVVVDPGGGDDPVLQVWITTGYFALGLLGVLLLLRARRRRVIAGDPGYGIEKSGAAIEFVISSGSKQAASGSTQGEGFQLKAEIQELPPGSPSDFPHVLEDPVIVSIEPWIPAPDLPYKGAKVYLQFSEGDLIPTDSIIVEAFNNEIEEHQFWSVINKLLKQASGDGIVLLTGFDLFQTSSDPKSGPRIVPGEEIQKLIVPIAESTGLLQETVLEAFKVIGKAIEKSVWPSATT